MRPHCADAAPLTEQVGLHFESIVTVQIAGRVTATKGESGHDGTCSASVGGKSADERDSRKPGLVAWRCIRLRTAALVHFPPPGVLMPRSGRSCRTPAMPRALSGRPRGRSRRRCGCG